MLAMMTSPPADTSQRAAASAERRRPAVVDRRALLGCPSLVGLGTISVRRLDPSGLLADHLGGQRQESVLHDDLLAFLRQDVA